MKTVIAILVAAAVLAAVFCLTITPIYDGSSRGFERRIAESAAPAPTNHITALRTVLHDLYGGNGMSATSAVVRILVAQRLRTNNAFLAWGTNTAKAAICNLARSGVPLYGARAMTESALTVRDLAVLPSGGIYVQAQYDPNPAAEGPLEFVVEGGANPILTLAQNRYRMAAYQIDPEVLGKGSPEYPRKVGRLDWSTASAKLDTAYVETLSREAFVRMTGMELDQAYAAFIRTPGIPDPNARHPEVQVSGAPGATISTPLDNRYPYAEFQWGETNSPRRPFNGQIVQTQPGQGEFVKLFFAPPANPDALFELWSKFSSSSASDAAQILSEMRGMSEETRVSLLKQFFK